MATILITGGSGLIGRRLSQALQAQGHEVRWLSRRAGETGGIRSFVWNVAAGALDPRALEGVDRIVHLAGAGIADKRWTQARVAELIASRTDSARLLLRKVKELNHQPQCIVSAAGIGYYGAVTRDAPFTEDDGPGHDTIARISVDWERAVDEWATVCRVVKLRTPIVLAAEGGALPKLAAPVKWGLGAPLGSGRQWMPWIHIDDLVAVYLRALDNPSFTGAFNTVAGNATNRDFTRAVAQALGRPLWLPPVPGFALRAALGEMAGLLLEGSPVGSRRLPAELAPKWNDLGAALRDLLAT